MHKSRIFSRIGLNAVGLALLALVYPALTAAQALPSPPCGAPPAPAYAPPAAAPNVRVVHEAAGRAWRLPACTGWSTVPTGTVVALSASFSVSGAQAILQRLGEVSKLRGMRYWSVSDRNWRDLISDAYALTRRDEGTRRADFSPAELQSGRDLYFAQSDTRSSGEVIYRMRLREFSPDRVVVESENITPVRAWVVTLFAPGELRAVYFFERREGERWGYYALNAAAGRSATGNDASLINRAVAYQRHFTGTPTDGAAPLAP